MRFLFPIQQPSLPLITVVQQSLFPWFKQTVGMYNVFKYIIYFKQKS